MGLIPGQPGEPGLLGKPVFLCKSELKKFASTPSPVDFGSNFLFGDATYIQIFQCVLGDNNVVQY
jgi:hypothetical protein